MVLISDNIVSAGLNGIICGVVLVDMLLVMEDDDGLFEDMGDYGQHSCVVVGSDLDQVLLLEIN